MHSMVDTKSADVLCDDARARSEYVKWSMMSVGTAGVDVEKMVVKSALFIPSTSSAHVKVLSRKVSKRMWDWRKESRKGEDIGRMPVRIVF